MRTVALEEHFALPKLVSRIDPAVIRQRGFPAPNQGPDTMAGPHEKLTGLGAERIEDMDAGGITVQVLSWSGPGADLLPGDEGVSFARAANDALAGAIAEHPGRYAGLPICRRKAPTPPPMNWSALWVRWGPAEHWSTG